MESNDARAVNPSGGEVEGVSTAPAVAFKKPSFKKPVFKKRGGSKGAVCCVAVLCAVWAVACVICAVSCSLCAVSRSLCAVSCSLCAVLYHCDHAVPSLEVVLGAAPGGGSCRGCMFCERDCSAVACVRLSQGIAWP